MLKSKLSNTN